MKNKEYFLIGNHSYKYISLDLYNYKVSLIDTTQLKNPHNYIQHYADFEAAKRDYNFINNLFGAGDLKIFKVKEDQFRNINEIAYFKNDTQKWHYYEKKGSE